MGSHTERDKIIYNVLFNITFSLNEHVGKKNITMQFDIQNDKQRLIFLEYYTNWSNGLIEGNLTTCKIAKSNFNETYFQQDRAPTHYGVNVIDIL